MKQVYEEIWEDVNRVVNREVIKKTAVIYWNAAMHLNPIDRSIAIPVEIECLNKYTKKYQDIPVLKK